MPVTQQVRAWRLVDGYPPRSAAAQFVSAAMPAGTESQYLQRSIAHILETLQRTDVVLKALLIIAI